MKLKLVRISSQADSTNGVLYIDDKFACFTLEDEQREIKVQGETAIPLGIYQIEFRNVGGFHSKYAKRFSDIHEGMLELQNVPNFQYILIHCGNTDEHTAGCILLGDSQENNVLLKDGFIGKSTQAYKRVYPRIAKALKNNEKVEIEIVDINNLADDIDDDEFKINSQMVWDKLADINGKLKLIDVKLDGKKII
ncbi:MAG: hypothetical protein Unbinned6224contig1003_3 [Prokaryotic dsDNA virus sp.]|nr:MAG: hypothetical protein Unbinned6224contig1003_3 [Prokaryotic dsDNA virus sp.]